MIIYHEPQAIRLALEAAVAIVLYCVESKGLVIRLVKPFHNVRTKTLR